MSQDFKPIFEYLDGMKAELKAEIREVKAVVDSHTLVLDMLSKEIKGFNEEMIVNRHRIDRLEEWARKVSAQTGIPLPF